MYMGALDKHTSYGGYLLRCHLHDHQVLFWNHASFVKLQSVFNLLLQLLAIDGSWNICINEQRSLRLSLRCLAGDMNMHQITDM